MFRYILVLLLVYEYDRGLGTAHPVDSTTNGSTNIADYLKDLAAKCESPTLTTNINNKYADCNIVVTKPHTQNMMHCLLFYDINSQLCSAVGSAKIALKDENYTTRINETVNINNLCVDAKSWNIEFLPNFDFYKDDIQKAMGAETTCLKLCSVGDFLSTELSFYCKYFKWGMDMLKPQTVLTPVSNNEAIEQSPIANADESKANNENIGEVPKPILAEKTVGLVSNAEKDTLAKTENTDINSEATRLDTTTNNESSKPIPEQPSVSNKDEGTPKDNVNVVQNSPSNIEENTNKEANVPVENPKRDPETEMEKPGPDLSFEKKDNLKPINNIDPDEYQGGDLDSEDGKEGLSDIQGSDDGDDPAIVEAEPKPVHEKNKITINKIDSSISSFNGDAQRDIFPNMQDFPDNNDDKFFPVFFTIVILVILLYVLYHNKNKVSKVVLGLIVEGRQSGRRRNSRGHAYRRLDTLEQAMSSNTAAAPSKIIY